MSTSFAATNDPPHAGCSQSMRDAMNQPSASREGAARSSGEARWTKHGQMQVNQILPYDRALEPVRRRVHQYAPGDALG